METLSYVQLMERCLAAEARVVELAAENVAIREQYEEVYAAGYNHGHLNTVDGIAYATCVKDDFYSLALQVMAEVETPTTNHIIAGVKVDGVEEFVAYCGEENSVFVEAKAYYRSLPDAAYEFCSMLRELTK